MGVTYDFSGWATKNDLLCSDGRVIRRDAFKDNDGQRVPLVWNHLHNDPENVLGHADLENREDGVYAYCSFNDTPAGQRAKALVKHNDVRSLSIYANQLKQKGSEVLHGAIREVSLVLAGANPGATIDLVMAHGDDEGESMIIGCEDVIDIRTVELAHSACKTKEDQDEDEKDPETDEELDDEEVEETEDDSEAEDAEEKKEIKHSQEENDMAEEAKKEKTVKDVFDTLNEEQKTVVYAMIGEAIKEAKGGKEEDSEGGKENMKHNVFDNDQQDDVLMHSELQEAVIADAKRYGSMKESFMQHSAEYGIDNIDWLFPEYKNVNGNGAPGFVKILPDAWVDVVTGGVHHTPFSRIKMMFADLREDDARARGYQKGKLKKEEVFGLLRRTVDPCTVYKKQKFDRDDVIDITDFDVISWVKGEMRMMLDEELARAILFGDGRSSLSEDKISESNIIPIYKDAALYTIQKTVTAAEGETLGHALINASVKAQDDYEGSGNLTCFISAGNVSDMLLLEDTQGHRMYKDMNDLALAMGVERIVKVPASIIPTHVYAVIVDLKDYNVGADKGGAVNMFDDFDIDYNQQKYLIETRCSGALIKPYSAICLQDGSLS